jgi:hypothetical protein
MNDRDAIMRSLEPMLSKGYEVLRADVADRHFGNVAIVLSDGTINVRIICERGKWFAELASAQHSNEWFDSAIVYRYLDKDAPAPTRQLGELITNLISAAAKWELLFRPDVFAETLRSLKAIERRSAEERFGYTSQ